MWYCRPEDDGVSGAQGSEGIDLVLPLLPSQAVRIDAGIAGPLSWAGITAAVEGGRSRVCSANAVFLGNFGGSWARGTLSHDKRFSTACLRDSLVVSGITRLRDW